MSTSTDIMKLIITGQYSKPISMTAFQSNYTILVVWSNSIYNLILRLHHIINHVFLNVRHLINALMSLCYVYCR